MYSRSRRAEPVCHKSGVTEQPDRRQLAGLAGRYELTLVNANGEYGDSLIRGTLVLWPNDSAGRYMQPALGRGPGERPLAGRFESRSTTVPNLLNRYERGAPEHPVVEMVEATLYLGGPEYSDAGGNELRVQETTPGGFRGVWTSSSGFSVTRDSATGRALREPNGYFCARRIG